MTHVVLKSAQLLLAEDDDEGACPGAGGGVVIGCWADVGVTEAVARRLIGASLSGIRFCVIGWKPTRPAPELPAQPAGLTRLRLVHLQEQRGRGFR